MTRSPTPQIQSSLSEEPIPAGDVSYYCERLRNRVFEDVMRAFAQEAAAGRITKAALARKLGKRPEQITRWFSGPSNWTLDTIGTLLLALDAELESKVVFLRDRLPVNYAHPLVESLVGEHTIESKRRRPSFYVIEAPSKKPRTGASESKSRVKLSIHPESA